MNSGGSPSTRNACSRLSQRRKRWLSLEQAIPRRLTFARGAVHVRWNHPLGCRTPVMNHCNGHSSDGRHPLDTSIPALSPRVTLWLVSGQWWRRPLVSADQSIAIMLSFSWPWGYKSAFFPGREFDDSSRIGWGERTINLCVPRMGWAGMYGYYAYYT